MSYVLLSDDKLLPDIDTVLNYDNDNRGNQQFQRFLKFMRDNLKKSHTNQYLATSFFLLALYFFQKFVAVIILSIFEFAMKKGFKVEEDQQNEAHSEDFYRELLINPLSD